MPALVHIDGRVVPAEQARVPVFDRGFLYGDGVYEVFRTYNGVPFGMAAHLDRMCRSGELLGYELFPSKAALAEVVGETLAAAEHGDSYVRVMVTRGAGPLSLDPSMADKPRIVVIVKEVRTPPVEAYRDGIEISIVGVVRTPPGAVDPAAKSGNYLNNIMALRQALQRGASEALMCNVDGKLSEGASSNIFVVHGDAVRTPSVGAGILEGITRRNVLDLAAAAGMDAGEGSLEPADLRSADEAFITSSIREILPVCRVDGQAVGGGAPGPITRRLHEAYKRAVAEATGPT